MNIRALALSAILALGAFSTSAYAATVVNDGTSVGGNFVSQGFTSVAVSDPNGNWDDSTTTPTSEWLWDAQAGDGQTTNGELVWEYEFDLTDFDVASATISGLVGMDNFGTIALNGTTFFSVTGNTVSNYSILSGYGTSTDPLFNQGLNTLTYSVTNNDGPGGFRATLNVQANVVPLPAAAWMLLAGLGGLGAMRRFGRKS